MGDLITPEMRLVNTKFELQVDKWKFVGHPRKIPSFKDGEDTRALVFNIVFILEVGGTLVGGTLVGGVLKVGGTLVGGVLKVGGTLVGGVLKVGGTLVGGVLKVGGTLVGGVLKVGGTLVGVVLQMCVELSPFVCAQVSSESDLCMQCHELSARLGTCLDHEERRCDYVSHELQGLLNRVEYSNLTCLEDFAQVYRTVAKESSLVKTLISVFNRCSQISPDSVVLAVLVMCGTYSVHDACVLSWTHL